MDSELNAMVDAPDRCPRFGKWLRGCRFEPRYTVIPPERLSTEDFKGTVTSWNAMVHSMSERRYQGDVCIRCGKRAMKPEPAKDPAP